MAKASAAGNRKLNIDSVFADRRRSATLIRHFRWIMTLLLDVLRPTHAWRRPVIVALVSSMRGTIVQASSSIGQRYGSRVVTGHFG
jgi:hypothetical protein